MRLRKLIPALLLAATFVLAFNAKAQTPGGFSATGNMSVAHDHHTATLLNNGQVLMAGGYNGGYLTTAELFNPAAGTFTLTGTLNTAREYHTATLLSNGLVLIAGGYNGAYLSSAELYNPATGTFTVTGSLNTARAYQTATLLNNGLVLMTGGYGSSGTLASAEVYDPSTGIFTVTGNLNTVREHHTATLLNNGQVLVAGGYKGTYLNTAELYNPVTGVFTLTGSLNTARAYHSATLLNSGQVLMAGGYNGSYLSSAELYNPATGVFTAAASLNTAREYHSATSLSNGQVLVAGGYNGAYLTSAELYNPATNVFAATGSLNTARAYQTATLLNNGTVLVTGGNNAGYLSSAELYSPAAQTFALTGSLNTGRANHTATLLSSGLVLVVGGYDSNANVLASAELYDPSTGTFSVTGSLNTARADHTATLLANGMVLVAGGIGAGDSFLSSAELYDPTTGTFTATGSLVTARALLTATLLGNGTVLMAGGLGSGDIPLASAELYNTTSGTFTATGNMNSARYFDTANLLNNGLVLMAGGYGTAGVLGTAELYNSATGTFALTGNLVTARYVHIGTTLNNGEVLIAGGLDTNTNILASAELYNPTTGSFASTGSLIVASEPTATLLQNGMVLVLDGWSNAGNVDTLYNSAELYNPITGTFASTGSLNVARYLPTVTPLFTGEVLVAAGGTLGTTVLSSAELYQLTAVSPLIASASPASGAVGTSVTITGTNFGTTQGVSTVTFNGVTATPTSWNATTIVVPVPSGATSGGIVVTVGGVPSNSVFFAITIAAGSAPKISSISPTSGQIGTPITVTGTNFGSTQGTSLITFNGIVGTPTSWNATTIVAPVPNGASTGNLLVAVLGVSSNGKVVSVTGNPPNVGSVTPNSGATGSAVTIAGTNFGATRGTSTVKFNGTAATPTSWSATNIVVAVPSGATAGNIIVTVSGVASNGVNFTVVPAPSITSLSLSSGAAGTQVTITGTNFGATQGTNFGSTSGVTFNGTVASVVSWSATSVVVLVPVGATTGNVLVTVSGVASNGKPFTVLAAPTITSVTPSFGWPGTSTFAFTGSLHTARAGHTATLLNNGLVLIAGGINGGTYLSSAELYNPTTGVFTVTGSLNTARSQHTATLLNNGMVLIAGGYYSPGLTTGLSSAELYNPTTGTFTAISNMTTGRVGHTATLLNNGLVLIAGGGSSSPQISAELYNPTAGTFTATGNMVTGRAFHTASLLTSGIYSGMVLIAGGSGTAGVLSSAELYNPTAGTFTATGSMLTARTEHTATLVDYGNYAGTVMMAGGSDGSGNSIRTFEFFNNGEFEGGLNLNTARVGHTATALNNTWILVAGGFADDTVLSSAELYDPTDPLFVYTGSLNTARTGHTATLLNNGMVLIVGGSNGTTALASAELYDPATEVTIAGTNFGSTQGTSTVTFNGTTATPMFWAYGSDIIVPVPSGATTGSVVVTVGGIPSNPVPFTVVSLPTISSLSPTSGSVGTSVTITGTNFGAGRGTSSVTFNGTTGNPTSWTSTTIVVPAPSGATTGNVVVTVSGVPSNGVNFSVTAAPSIISLSATAASVGAPITITGMNFGSTQGTSTVTFNGTSGTPTTWNAGSIVVAVPTGATTGNVVVTVGGVASNAVAFTVLNPPVITSVAPTSGTIGSTVTITGANFGTTQGTSTVTFYNQIVATAVTWGPTSITAVVPIGATTGNIVVTVSGVVSNGASFTLLGVPSITSLSPALGPVGTSVTISGANFGATQGTSTVKFNGTTATPTTWNAASIVAPVPSGTTTGNVVVTVSGEPSNGVLFTVSAVPHITSLSPSSGAIGAPVTISGTNFGTTRGTSTVTFNGVSATPTAWGSTSVAATVPNGATTGNVVVTVSGVASNGVAFTVSTAAPSITNLSTTSGSVGTAVTITGTNFGATQSGSTVTFNGVPATPSGWGPTSISTTVPNGATTGNVVVTVLGLASNGVAFTVAAAPSISSLSPTSGLAGTPVTITGANFGSTQGTSTVKFNATTATPTTWNATTIVVPVPSGATSGGVIVTVGGVASNAVGFSVASVPSITSISPTAGGIGTPVTITGANFGATQGTSTVTFNGIAATPTSWGPNSITVPVPNGGTSGNIVVTVAGVQSNGKTFNVANPGPSIAFISPTNGTVGSSVTIYGVNFGLSEGTSKVVFNQIIAASTVLGWSPTQIVVNVPFGATTGPITVQVGTSISNGVLFVVTPPNNSGVGENTSESLDPFGAYDYGFDVFSAPDIPTMQTVWNWSPFYDIFAYIGGPSKLPGSLGAMSPAWTGTLGTYGWGIGPIWVGRQPPFPVCATRSGLAYYTDPTGTQDGTNDGNDAADAADNLAMPFSIIYTDIERYNTVTACHQPVQNYVAAWVSAVHKRGYLAGVYFHHNNYSDMEGQSGSGLPDAAWVTYELNNPTCGASSPYGLGAPPDSYLPNARARQYDLDVQVAGGDCAVFGSLTNLGGNTTVDWDVEDAPVLSWSSPTRQLPAPLLTSPFDGTVEPANSDVTLQWNALNAAIYGYWVVVADNLASLPPPGSTSMGCQGTCIINTPWATNTGTIAGCLLQPGVTYFWTVQGLGVYKLGAWQVSGSFTVGSSGAR